MIFINFKTYEQGTGANAVELAKKIENLALNYQVKTVFVVQASDVKEVVESTKLEVWSQKIDPIDYGAHTGGVLPEAVFEDGASGTFLNHSESRFSEVGEIERAVKRCNEVGLKTLVFAKDLDELTQILKFSPTFVSYEPPELVGSTKTSVAEEKPEVISSAVELAKNAGIPLIVGAGIKSAEDIRISISLGAVGVAVASDIVKSENPEAEYSNLVSGFEHLV